MPAQSGCPLLRVLRLEGNDLGGREEPAQPAAEALAAALPRLPNLLHLGLGSNDFTAAQQGLVTQGLASGATGGEPAVVIF